MIGKRLNSCQQQHVLDWGPNVCKESTCQDPMQAARPAMAMNTTIAIMAGRTLVTGQRFPAWSDV